MSMQDLVDTVKAASKLGIPPQTLVTWRSTKRVKIPYVKIGGNVRYKLGDLDAYVAANTHDCPSESEAA